MMKVSNWAHAVAMLEAGGVMHGYEIRMPNDSESRYCWMQVRDSLEKRQLLTANPAGPGWVLNRKSPALREVGLA
jgi:hypothetical protein